MLSVIRSLLGWWSMILNADHWFQCPDCSDADITVAGYGRVCWSCQRPMPTAVWKPADPLPCTHGVAAREIIE